MKELWHKLPAWLHALIIGALLFFPAISVIQLLLFQNLARYTSIPWSFPIVVLMLWFYWKFVTGSDKPFKSSKNRKDLSMSADDIQGNMFWMGMSIIGLILFTYSVVAVGYAFVDEDTDQFAMISLFLNAPDQTAITLVLALSLTAGIIEEVVFRGYVQTILERNYGIVVSFIVTAIIFALLHFLPTVLLIPYLLVSMGFSYVAYKSRTIVPGIIAHATFDFIAIMLIFFHPVMATQAYFKDSIIISIVMVCISAMLIGYSQVKVKPTKLHIT